MWMGGGRVATALAVAALVAGCGSTDAPVDSTGQGGASPNPSPGASTGQASPGGSEDTAWILDPAATPIDLALTLDAGKAVEAVVPIEGGSVTATGADGTVYTLDILRTPS